MIFPLGEVPAAIMGEEQDNGASNRLTGKHYPVKIPSTPARKEPFRRCAVCRREKGVRKETKFYCPKCPKNPGLCVDPCFSIYHTKINF
jgi:hypothetical protein